LSGHGEKAFLDDSLTHHNLTSANSINIARWLPQMFYFFCLGTEKEKRNWSFLVQVVFRNICAGIMAKS
jgi:threonine synthase